MLRHEGQIANIDHAIAVHVSSGIEAGLAVGFPKYVRQEREIGAIDLAVVVHIASYAGCDGRRHDDAGGAIPERGGKHNHARVIESRSAESTHSLSCDRVVCRNEQFGRSEETGTSLRVWVRTARNHFVED